MLHLVSEYSPEVNILSFRFGEGILVQPKTSTWLKNFGGAGYFSKLWSVNIGLPFFCFCFNKDLILGQDFQRLNRNISKKDWKMHKMHRYPLNVKRTDFSNYNNIYFKSIWFECILFEWILSHHQSMNSIEASGARNSDKIENWENILFSSSKLHRLFFLYGQYCTEPFKFFFKMYIWSKLFRSFPFLTVILILNVPVSGSHEKIKQLFWELLWNLIIAVWLQYHHSIYLVTFKTI